MSKAYEMISESLNEIIEDLEKNDGKNLSREILTEEVQAKKILQTEKIFVKDKTFFEQTANL